MPGNTISITSGNTSFTFSTENIKQVECDGFLQIADSSTLQNVFSQSENATFNGSKRFDGFNSNALICMKNENQSTITKVSEGLGYATIVLSTLSLFCIALRLILQAFYKPYHTSPGKMQFQLSLALVLANVLLLTSPLAVNIPHVCAIVGALKHTCFISLFCWMTCISADAWRMFRPSNITVNNNDPIVKISIVVFGLCLWCFHLLYRVGLHWYRTSYFPEAWRYSLLVYKLGFNAKVFCGPSRCAHSYERNFLHFGLEFTKCNT